MANPTRRRVLTAAGATAVVGLTTACQRSGGAPRPARTTSQPGMGDVVITHIHGVDTEPGTGHPLIAIHEGLFRLTPGPVRVGPVIDLMGFTIRADGTYLASGHPGLGSDLPDPVGLISSRDRGGTWTPRSRAGASDFHALAVTGPWVVGYDGTLQTSRDLTTWLERDIPSPPRVLTASPNGALLATSAAGLLASRDQGRNWRTVPTPQLPLVAAWANHSTIVAASTTGNLMLSRDTGKTWTTGRTPVGQVEALTARTSDRRVTVTYVVGTRVYRTSDLDTRGKRLL